ncbi:MAG: 4Fe-4S binding protein [Erysipelotrichaceae bacterium]
MPVTVFKDDCIGCGTCVGVCPTGALQMQDDGKAECVEGCIDCGACIPECPTEAIKP